MPSYAFDHVHLTSADPAKTADFYEKMFGARRVSVRDFGNGQIIVNLDLNGTRVLISKAAGQAAQPGLAHFGIRTDNLSKAVEDLKTRGVKFSREITEVQPGFKISFVSAPENVSIELQEGSL